MFSNDDNPGLCRTPLSPGVRLLILMTFVGAADDIQRPWRSLLRPIFHGRLRSLGQLESWYQAAWYMALSLSRGQLSTESSKWRPTAIYLNNCEIPIASTLSESILLKLGHGLKEWKCMLKSFCYVTSYRLVAVMPANQMPGLKLSIHWYKF